MQNIISSATRICLLMFAAAIIVGRFTNHVSEETFKVAALMVFTAFFAMKSASPADPTLGNK